MFGSKKRDNRKFIDRWIVDILVPYETISANESLASQQGALLDYFVKFLNDPRSAQVVVKLEELDSPAYLVDNICKDAAEKMPPGDILAAAQAFAYSNAIYEIGNYRPGSGVCEIATKFAKRCPTDEKLKLLEIFDGTEGLAKSMSQARWDYQVFFFDYIFTEIENVEAVRRLRSSRSWNVAKGNPHFGEAIKVHVPNLTAAV